MIFVLANNAGVGVQHLLADIADRTRHTERKFALDDGEVDRSRRTHACARAVFLLIELKGGDTLELVKVRLFGDHLYCAANGVRAPKRALRATQHFNPLHIEEIGEVIRYAVGKGGCGAGRSLVTA